MQYFVSFENNSKTRWQMELLWESMRLMNIQQELLVAVCPSNAKEVALPYPHIVRFENHGDPLHFPALNKIMGLIAAIQKGALGLPFVLLEPDMFLLRPIPVNNAAITAQKVHNLGWDALQSIGHPLEGYRGKEDTWRGVGGVYQFLNVTGKFFEDVANFVIGFMQAYSPGDGRLKRYNDLLDVAFNLAISTNEIAVEPVDNYMMPLDVRDAPKDTNWQSFVVHYEDGYTPYFHQDTEGIDFAFDLPTPFKTILKAPSEDQPNVALMQVLVKLWLTRNKNRISELFGDKHVDVSWDAGRLGMPQPENPYRFPGLDRRPEW